ncbi:response regulator transcription factor [Aristaeella hokkaidonensis]|uniref:Response regulator transcription factor n=1 Tax=Aristaeella hokkaidonensis TaxID=3046382 RepID=A0AC61MY78_9FIRM|nr:response regulator transcription factor [Aristaeella hokkaidonensis]QUC68022.1 response regulator transcription factor [Aristaeella hokkaidonensis]SNT93093.1 DNA-binding response regulator, OmpR family, contains REC and winged-helix (wHTH) domain [Aristaeella hokkaidonensis]
MSKILIVEDEKKIARFLELELKHEGYDVITAFDGRSGLDTALEENPDLLILDLMLPELSGIEVCRRLRHTSDVPIIMLTAKDDVSDKVMGLDMGADDYVTKPFAIEELLARIRVALKKNRMRNVQAAPEEDHILKAGCISIDTASWQVRVKGEPVSLTKKEFDTLKYLMEHKGTAVTRDKLMNEVWGYDYFGDSNIVDVYIRYLRHKIDDQYNIKTIHTIRSVGYLFDYEEEQE